MEHSLTKQNVFSNIRVSVRDLQETINKLETRDDITLIDLISIRIKIQRITFEVEQM